MKMKFTELIKRRYFYIQLLLATVLFSVLIWSIFFGIAQYTKHGDEIVLPNFCEKHSDSLVAYAEKYDLRIKILDSIFDIERSPGVIVRQDPPAYSKIKEGRMIYITVVAALTEKVTMPNLTDLSLRQAVEVLEQNKLHVEHINFMAGFDQNAVQYQLIGRDTISPDTLVPIGTGVTLVVSQKSNYFTERLPFLLGTTKSQAEKTIYQSSFNVGEVVIKGDFSPVHSIVYKQIPSWNPDCRLELGASVDLFFCNDTTINLDSLLFWYTLENEVRDSVLSGLIPFEMIFENNDKK